MASLKLSNLQDTVALLKSEEGNRPSTPFSFWNMPFSFWNIFPRVFKKDSQEKRLTQ